MIAPRVYGVLLGAFPRPFRRRYAAAMRRIFRERYEAAAARGMSAQVAFFTQSVIDVLTNAAQERAAAARQWLVSESLPIGSAPSAHRWLRLPLANRLLFPQAHEQLAQYEQERRPMIGQAAMMDVRYALRMFIRTPVFTGLTVPALALGIGANSAIFSVVYGVLLKPLPYDSPEQLVMVWSDNTREARPEYPMSPANYLDYKAEARAVRDIEALFSFVVTGTLQTPTGTEQVIGSVVTPGLFPLLGRSAALGRPLMSSDTAEAVVLSHGYWQRRFGGDPSVVGQQIVLNEQPATIVGVMPRDFVFPFKGMLGPTGFTTSIDPDLWTILDPASRNVPYNDANGNPNRSVHFLSVIGRLAPGATIAQAHEEALAIARRLEEAFPDSNKGLRANAVLLHEQAVGKLRPALGLLFAGVGFVLLIACANVANLLLARSMVRQKEMAVRTALGAGRLRLLQQTLTESLLLAMFGGLAGLLIVRGATRLFVALAPPDMPRLQEITPNWYVVAFTALVALIVGIAVGLLPALAATRQDVQSTLKESGRGTSSGAGQRRARVALVIAEVALAVVLTTGAGLLLRSFVSVLDVDPGFRSEQLLTLQITLPGRIATPDARRVFYRDLFSRLESLDGVTYTGGTTRLPLGSTNVTTRVAVDGRSMASSEMPEVEFRRAVHNYFQAMGIPVIRGRSFADADGPDSPPVVMVNQTMARKIWPNEDPIGSRIRMGPSPTAPLNTVIGVVGDIRHSGLDIEPAPEVYISYLQNPPVAPFIVVRTTGDPAVLTEAVRTQLKALDKDLAVYDIRTMTQIRSQSVSQRRFIVVLAAVFGILALALAAVGVYGVMALVVTERTQEMGIRVALGAEPLQVVRLVVRQGLLLAGAGIAIGSIASLALTPMMSSQLYGVGASDPLTLVLVPGLLLAVALVACLVPARRAMRVDPVTALRYE